MKKCIGLLGVCAVLNCCSMSIPVTLVYQTYTSAPNVTVITGILCYSQEPKDCYKCEVSFNSRTNAYAGKYFSNGIADEGWQIAVLSSELAHTYFQTLLEIYHRNRAKVAGKKLL